MTLDLNYYESGYIESGYFSYTADASAGLNLTCTSSISISVIKESQVIMSSTFNQTSILSNTKGADLFAFTEAALAAEVTRIRENNIQVSSVFDISTQGLRSRYVSAQCDADAAISFDLTRYRTDSAAIDAAFSSSVDIETYTRFDASITSDFELVAKMGGNQYADASISSSFELTSTVRRIIEFTIECESLFSPTIDCTPIRNSVSVFESNFELTCLINKYVGIESSFNSEFVVVPIGYKIVEFESALNSSFELTSVISKVTGYESYLSSTFTQHTDIINYVGYDTVISSSFDLIANNIRIIDFIVTCESLFTPSIEALCLVNHDAFLETNAILTAIVDATKTVSSNQTASFTQTVLYSNIKGTSSNLSSNVSLSATGTFGNKRPISAYPVGSSITFTNFSTQSGTPIGGYSLQIPAYSTGQYVRIEHKNNRSITAGEQFYLTITATLPRTGTIPNNTSYPIFKDSTNNLSISFTNTSGTLYATFKVGATTIQNALTWDNSEQYIRFEIGRDSTNGQIHFSYLGFNSGSFNQYVTTTSAITLGNYFTLNGYSSGLSHIDETYFSIGYSRGVGQLLLGNAIASDPDAQFLYHFNNNYIDDKAATYQMSSYQYVTATVVSNPGKSVIDSASLNSNASLVCDARLMPTEFDSSLSSNASLVCDSNKIIRFNSDQYVTSMEVIDNSRIRNLETQFESIATELSVIGRIGHFFITAEVTASLVVNPTITTDIAIDLQMNASTISDIHRIREFDSLQSSNASLTSTIIKVIPYTATITSSFEVIANETKVILFSSSQSVVSEMYASTYQLASATANLSSNTSLIAIVNPVRKFESVQSSSFSQVTNTKRFRSLISNQNSNATLNNQLIRIRKVDSTIQAFVSQLTAIAKKVNEFSQMQVVSSLHLEPTVIIGRVKADLVLTTNLICAQQRLRTNSSAIQAQTALNASITKTVATSAILNTAFICTAVGTRFYLDPDLTYVIPYEDRSFVITNESREFTIKFEDRTYIIGT